MYETKYVHTYTQVHIYNLLFTHIHLITRIHIHARVDKEKRRYRSYIEIYISFSLYIYIYIYLFYMWPWFYKTCENIQRARAHMNCFYASFLKDICLAFSFFYLFLFFENIPVESIKILYCVSQVTRAISLVSSYFGNILGRFIQDERFV